MIGFCDIRVVSKRCLRTDHSLEDAVAPVNFCCVDNAHASKICYTIDFCSNLKRHGSWISAILQIYNWSAVLYILC